MNDSSTDCQNGSRSHWSLDCFFLSSPMFDSLATHILLLKAFTFEPSNAKYMIDLVCVWILLILLKTENNKKIFFGYCSLMNLLCIFLDALDLIKKGQKRRCGRAGCGCSLTLWVKHENVLIMDEVKPKCISPIHGWGNT